jgi:hypothetical protein
LKAFKYTLLFIITATFSACDDGNIITTTFNFDENTNLSLCQQSGVSVLHFIDQETNEAIAFQFSDDEFDGTFTGIDENTIEVSFNINNSNRVIYRRLSDNISGNEYFCQEIPPGSPRVLEEFVSTTGGTATLQIRVFEQDDNDDVPAELEDINGNGELFDDDSDGDGIPDFLDTDDDNDNVFTSSEELLADDEDENVVEIDGVLYVDTDADTIPNYLDDDDDGDGVLTRNEDLNACEDPENPALNPDNDLNADGLQNYLNPDETESLSFNIDNIVKANTIRRSFFTQVVFNDITFENTSNNESLTFTSFIMGRYNVNNVEQDLEFNNSVTSQEDAANFCQ